MLVESCRILLHLPVIAGQGEEATAAAVVRDCLNIVVKCLLSWSQLGTNWSGGYMKVAVISSADLAMKVLVY